MIQLPPPPAKRTKVTREAPNRLINWNHLQSVVNSNLGPCRTCHSTGMKLEETASCSFATSLELVCKTCNTDSEENRLELIYMNKKMDKMPRATKKERTDYCKVCMKRNHALAIRNKKYYLGVTAVVLNQFD